MAKPIMESNFIVISGSNPQTHKKARIRQVRSHITKEYFRKQQDERQQRIRQHQVHIRAAPYPSSVEQVNQSSDDNSPRISSEVRTPIPFTCNSLLDADFLDTRMNRRVQQFFDSHLHTNTRRHPLISTVLCWAATTPHFMSAKILQGCAWDDIRETGELSEWAVRQRFITTRLLDDTFTAGVRLDSRVTVSTIQMLLGFELLNGNDENFLRLRDFCYSLTMQSVPSSVAWNHLLLGLSLLEQANLLRIAGNNTFTGISFQPDIFLEFESFPNLPFPMDASIFTFGQLASGEDNHLIYSLLGDLYQLVSIAASSRQTQVSRSTYEYVVSQRKRILATSVCTGEECNSSTLELNNIDTNLAPLQLSIFIITSWLLNDGDSVGRKSLAVSVSRLRALCTTNSKLQDAGLKLFPGALVWCYAIGVRFSDPEHDQKWFLMQFLRTTHAWMADALEDLKKNARMIVDCLERSAKLCVKVMEEPS